MASISSKEKRRHGSVRIPYSYYKCSIPDYFPMVPLHWHNEFELNYVTGGKSEFTYGKEKFVTDTGDIIIVPPNMLHAIYPYQDFRQTYETLVFREEMLGTGRAERGWVSCIAPVIDGSHEISVPVAGAEKAYAEIRACVERIFGYTQRDTPVADLYMKSELLRLFCLLQESGCIKAVSGKSDKSMESIRPALLFINRNYKENIDVGQLAEMVHLSRSHFMYRFKQVVGISAMEYVIQLRIKSACDMLRSSGCTSVEIAFACGFQNLSNFNRQFKKCVGCTPRQYRQLQKNF